MTSPVIKTKQYNMLHALLDRPVAFHRVFVRVTGGILPGLMLSQAFYWHPRAAHRDNWFYKSQKEWEQETGLRRFEQETARKKLRAVVSSTGDRLWEERRSGVPARLYYRINLDVLWELVAELVESTSEETEADVAEPTEEPTIQYAGIQHTGLLESSILDDTIPASQVAGSPHTISETTTQTTTQTTTETTAERETASLTPQVFDFQENRLIAVYYDIFDQYPTRPQMKIIVENDPPFADWMRACRAWAEAGFKASNIAGILDWTYDPEKFDHRPAPKPSANNRSSYTTLEGQPIVMPSHWIGDADNDEEYTSPY